MIRSNRALQAGFTMVELMLVIAIIVVAMGVMTPSMLEFMKNRELDGVKGQFGSIFSNARLQAVQRRRDISVVFFREGPRIFDEITKQFTDERIWNPEDSALAADSPKMWFALGFARGVSSFDPGFDREDYKPSAALYVPTYAWWEKRQEARAERAKGGASGKKKGRAGAPIRYDVSGLYKVTYRRDGTLVFGQGGSDVGSTFFKELDKQPAERDGLPVSDVVFLQLSSSVAGFIDLRPTGQFKSRIALLEEQPVSLGDVQKIRSSVPDSKGRKRKRK